MNHLTLNLGASITTMATIAIDLFVFAQASTRSFAQRLALVAAGGGWVGVAVYLGSTGRLAFSPDSPVPLIGVLFALPLLVAAALAFTLRNVRAALLQIPMELLIGMNAMRILGVLFLLDYLAGTLNGPFPFSAGIGDILTGALAIPLALQVARARQPSANAIRIWNAFGILDLVVAVALGITSAAGSPLQLIHMGVGSQAMQYLPLCLVPTVLVPFYLLTHLTVAAQLRARSKSVASKLPVPSMQAAA